MQELTVHLPDDLAAEVELRVQSGDFSSASDLVEHGIISLLANEKSMLDWLRQEVLTGHAEYLEDPSSGIPAERILDRIKLRRDATAS